MSTIPASLVKDLRDKTGAGMMDCKRALTECGGDVDEAKDWLRKRGRAIATKKAARKASEGLIFCHVTDDGAVGAILELNCETDFVARNASFTKLCEVLGRQIAAGGPGTSNNNAEEFLEAPLDSNPGTTIGDYLREHVARLGENIELGGFVRIERAGDSSSLYTYIHPPGKLGVMIEVRTSKAAANGSERFTALCQDLAMQVAAAAPQWLKREEAPQEVVEHERAIFRDQALNEKKPEKIIDKIIEGKLKKFYQQSCLLEQEFVKNPDESVAELIARVGKELDDGIEVVRFTRMKVGD